MSSPALANLAPLVGPWRMELHGAAFLPDPNTRVRGSVEFEWIERGAALAMRQGASPPAAVWIIGRDEDDANFQARYGDDRGVSRIYQMSFDVPQWQMWRTTPAFSQRFEAVIAPDAESIVGAWKKSIDCGATWEHDFNVDYIRTAPHFDPHQTAAASG